MGKNEFCILSSNGSLGVGFEEATLLRGLEENPCVVGVDSGTSDDGPYYLGESIPRMSTASAKWEMRLMIKHAVPRGIPVLVGSAGTAGSDATVEWLVKIVKEIAEEENMHFRVAVIKSELDAQLLEQYMKAGRFKPLSNAPAFTESDLPELYRCVAVMGAEPYQKALRDGNAQVVIAGRSTDTAIFSAVPLMLGAHPGYSWHAGKILECGSSCCAVQPHSDCVLARVNDDELIIEPLNPEYRCTPLSVAAHSLYENSNPFQLVEPGGVIHTENSNYEAADQRKVRITGTEWVPSSQYTVKLEGVKFDGYRRIVVAGVKDPLVQKQLVPWIEKGLELTRKKMLDTNGIEPDAYKIRYHIYGNPEAQDPGELGIMYEVIAKESLEADAIMNSLWHLALHVPIPEWEGMQSNLAFPVSPEVLDGGRVYTFCLNHVVEVDDPCELFRFDYLDV